MSHESCSVSEAARLLGLSAPTVRRMAADGELESFKTSGGHLRIPRESIEAMRTGHAEKREAAGPSPVLRNRRERLEELTIEAQEHRARRELRKLREEEQQEIERKETEAQAREIEAAQRQEELDLERERLEFEKVQERARQNQEQIEEKQRLDAERELATFRCRWQEKAGEALSAYQYHWLSAVQRKEVLGGLEAEIEKRQPADERRMPAIIVRILQALIEPLQVEREAQETRQEITRRALWKLPAFATDQEKGRATAAVREALRRFDSHPDESEMRLAVEDAIQPACQAVEWRLLCERLPTWGVSRLPWSATDQDKTRVRRECSEILAELALDVSEADAKEALEPTITEACQEIERRQAVKARQIRKASLIEQGVSETWTYLSELKRDGEISDEEFWDSELNAELKEAVRNGLESELSSDETTQEVRELVREIIDGQLE